MDKTKYNNRVKIMTYTLMSYCWAGRGLLPHIDMIICGFSGLIVGFIIVMIEKTFACPTYIARGIGAFFSAMAVIEICFFTGWAQSDALTIIASMIPSVAAGSMMIEGMCTHRLKAGKNKIITALLISVSLAAGVFLAVLISRARGLNV